MTSILDQILAVKHAEVAQARLAIDDETVRQAARAGTRPRNFYATIAAPARRGVHLIAEIKRASPSGGVLREDFDPVHLAETYSQAGAAALSVLTDETFFQGRLEFIAQVKQACPLPVLGKDFIIDEYQIYQSRAAGADAILLIADLLNPRQLLDFLIIAAELHMTSLVEVHDADALMQVRSAIGFPHARYSLLGINNRDLRTQEVDLGTTVRLAGLWDADQPLVSESGIKTRQDVLRLQRAGAKAMLVGETFMRTQDIPAKVRELLGG